MSPTWARPGSGVDPETVWVPDEHEPATLPHDRPLPEPPDLSPTRVSASAPLPVSATPPTPATVRRTTRPIPPLADAPRGPTPRPATPRSALDRAEMVETNLGILGLLRSIDHASHRSADADEAFVALARSAGWWTVRVLYGLVAWTVVCVLALLVAALVFLLLRS